ncbi:FtsW/RodA/SpoVE family cell cycle protein [Paludibacter sp.]
MSFIFKKYLKGDAVLWVVFVLLCVISTVEMYSASSTLAFKSANHSAPMMKHVAFLLFGALIAFCVHWIPSSYIRFLAFILLIVSIVTLIMVKFVGESANQAERWLELFGFQFQPSELGKLSVIIVAADLIARIKNSSENERKIFIWLISLSGLVCVLILSENFSTAALLFGVVFIMMYIAKISWKRLVLIIIPIIALAIIGYMVISFIPKETSLKYFDRAYTWKNRIDRFIFEKKDDTAKYVFNDENMQVQNGRIAIARGGAIGLMPGNSIQRDYLAQAYSDFIFAIIIEELGIVGGIFVILLYMVLLFRAGKIALESNTIFPAILVIGLTLMLVLQAFINMAVSTSLMPVTGQPLPLISRGGTSILTTSIYFGVLLSITRQIKEEKEGSKEKIEEVILEDDEDE